MIIESWIICKKSTTSHGAHFEDILWLDFITLLIRKTVIERMLKDDKSIQRVNQKLAKERLQHAYTCLCLRVCTHIHMCMY